MRSNTVHFAGLIGFALLWSSCTIQENTGLGQEDPNLAATASSSFNQSMGSSASDPGGPGSSSSSVQVLSSGPHPSSSSRTVTQRPTQPPNPMDTLSSCQWLEAAEYAEPDVYSAVLWNANGVMDTVFSTYTSSISYLSSQPSPIIPMHQPQMFPSVQALPAPIQPRDTPTQPTLICPTDSVRWKPQTGMYPLFVAVDIPDSVYVGVPYFLERVISFADTIYLNYGPQAQEPLEQPTVRINNAAQLQTQYQLIDPAQPPYHSELSVTLSRYDNVVGYWIHTEGSSPAPLTTLYWPLNPDPYFGCAPTDPCSSTQFLCPGYVRMSSARGPHAHYLYPTTPSSTPGQFNLTLHVVTRLGYRDSVQLQGEVLTAPVCQE